MDKNLVFGITGILLASILIFAVASVSNINFPPSTSDATISYHSNVEKYTTGYFEGRKTPAHQGINELIDATHNVLYTNGKEMIEQYLANSGSGNILNISLCNATGSPGCTTPVAGMTESFNNFTNCGLNAQNGAYASLGNGNWSVQKTFTSTCDNVLTNATRIMNATGSPFAGNSFTLVTLQTNDQITINWTIWVS